MHDSNREADYGYECGKLIHVLGKSTVHDMRTSFPTLGPTKNVLQNRVPARMGRFPKAGAQFVAISRYGSANADDLFFRANIGARVTSDFHRQRCFQSFQRCLFFFWNKSALMMINVSCSAAHHSRSMNEDLELAHKVKNLACTRRTHTQWKPTRTCPSQAWV